MEKSVTLFIAYAHEDETLLNQLKAHLRPLQREGLISLWHDRDISAGTEWEREISEQLGNSQIILLLVSPDFLNSDYCYGKEMKRALERHEQKEARVIPVIMRPVYWQATPLGKLLALPTDGQPITGSRWYTLDEAFYNVVEGIRKAIGEPSPQLSLSLPISPPTVQTVVRGEPLSTSFAQEVERLIRAKGFKTERIAAEGIDIIATKYGPFGMRIALALEPRDQLVEKDQVAHLYMQLHKFGANIGQFVARQGFTADAWRYAQEQERALVLRLLTYKDLVMGSVDFHPYLDHLLESWDHSDIDLQRLYLNPKARDEQGNTYHSLDSLILQKIDKSDGKRTVLLGNFGMGKTTFCKYFAYQLARKYKEQIVKGYVPILIDLSEYDNTKDMHQLIVHILQRNGVPDITTELLQELLHHTQFLFICDGFDEMIYGANRLIVQQNLKTLERMIALGSNALVITCRTHFFKNSIEEPDRLRYMRFYLTEWEDEDIGEYLQRAMGEDWEGAMKKITTTYNLRELASTPLFLDMIASSIDQLQGAVNAGNLYKIYTDRWITQQDYRSMMDKHQKTTLMEELAWNMFISGKLKNSPSQLRGFIHTLFDSVAADDVRYFEDDIRVCSFLTRDQDGNYRFSHQSFMEFFAARKLYREISQGISENLDKTQTSYEIDQFVKDFLVTDTSAINYLVQWMKNSDSPMLRSNCAGELAKLGNDKLNGEVINVLETDAGVREVWYPPLLHRVLKEDSLIKIGHRVLTDEEGTQRDPEWTEKELLDVANRFIEQLFNEQDLASRWFSARALSSLALKSEEVIHALLKAVSSDPDPGIKLACAQALRRIGDKATIDELIEALRRADETKILEQEKNI